MSTLLEQASLVMIPSGYKEDVVYSQIPTNGNGDLSFTRASNGTRINSAGLVEVVAWNLVEYSEQFTQYPPWLIQNITRADNVTTAPNGTTTAGKIYPSTTSSNPVLYTLGISVVSGQNYAVSIYAKSAGKNWLFIRTVRDNAPGVWFNLSTGTIGTQTSATGTIESVGDGWYRCTVIGAPTTTTGRCVYLVVDSNGTTTGTASGTDGIYIWGAQLNIGSTAKPYFPTTDRLNVPRLTYQNGGGGCPSLLLEKQSTNLCTYSEDLSNGVYTQSNVSVSANTSVSPDGTSNADTITSSAAIPQLISPAVSFASSTNVSLFVKYVSQKYVQLFSGGAFGDYVNFDIESGAVGSNGGTTTNAQIQSFGNGWYRISATFGGYTGTTTGRIGFVDSLSAGWNNLTSTTSKSIYGWGFQIEDSSYPTSYIPTTSSSATRVADACYKTGVSSLIGQTEGTIYVDLVITGTTGNNRFSISDGSNANWIFIGTPEDGATRASRFYIKTDNSVHVDVGVSSYFTIGQRYQLALAYKSGDWAVYGNGTLLYSGTNPIASVSSALSVFNFFNATSGNADCGEQINQAILFPTRLTNAELASLTTL